MSQQVQISARVSSDTIKKRDELVDHFQKTTLIGRVTAGHVLELAVSKLHEEIYGTEKVQKDTKNKLSERYGIKE